MKNLKNIDQDKPIKYLKRSDSNISKANLKSKHKHVYDKVVILAYRYEADYNNPNPHIFAEPHKYCSICGKIGESLWGLGCNGTYNTLFHTLERYKELYPDALVIKCKFNNLFKLKTIDEFKEAAKEITEW